MKPIFWRRWFVLLAFKWNIEDKESWSRWAWKASRWLATEKVHMKLAAYCTGYVMNARLRGEYEDPEPILISSPTKAYERLTPEDIQ